MYQAVKHHFRLNISFFIPVLLFLSACSSSFVQATAGPGLLLPLDTLYATTWVLDSYGDPSNRLAAPTISPVTLVFDRNQRLSGFTGCNQYSSQFTALVGGEISITGEIITTQMQCPELQDSFEPLYLHALAAVKNYGVSQEGKLELTYPSSNGSNHLLVFSASVVSLELTTWRLDHFGESNSLTPVSESANILLEFGEQGLLNGFSGCNPFQSFYTLENVNLAINPIKSPLFSCPDREKEQLEQKFFTILNRVNQQRVSNGKLTLTSQDGLVLVFSQNEYPVEDLVWTLIPDPNENLVPPITFSFFLKAGPAALQGSVSGFSGCNQFVGKYQIVNQVLRFYDLSTTHLKCSGTAAAFEQEMMDRLSNELQIRMVGDRLHLSTSEFSGEFTSSSPSLNGAAWRLIGAQIPEIPQAIASSQDFVLTWTHSPNATMGIISGTTSCGVFSGLYSFVDDYLSIQNLDFTPEGICTSELTMADIAWVKELSQWTHAQLVRDRLILRSEVDNRALIFQASPLVFAPASLPDGEMTLVSIDGTVTTFGISTTINFQFTPDGVPTSIRGMAGCNFYWASLNHAGIETISTGRDLCEDHPQSLQQEQRFLTSLMDSGFFTITGAWNTYDQWILNSPQGPLLFISPSALPGLNAGEQLTGSDWNLIFIGETSVPPGTSTDPTLSFSPDQTFSGSTGCANISGTFTYTEQHLSLDFLEQGTCLDDSLMPLETNLKELLREDLIFEVTPHILQISHDALTAVFFRDAADFISIRQEPEAIIQAPRQAMVRTRVFFDASRSKSLDKIDSYRWEFGDGKRSAKSPISHTYRKPGFYNVRLTITDQAGRVDTTEMVIEIVSRLTQSPSSLATPTPLPGQPIAVIQLPQQVEVGDVVTLEGLGSIANSSPIKQYQWDYGDGKGAGASSETQVTLLYNQPGNYLITLTVTDESGTSGSSSRNLQVNSPLEGTVWALDSLDSWLVPGSLILVEFKGGRLSGFSGCNLFQAEVFAPPSASTPADISITHLKDINFSCPSGYQLQESRFFENLSRVQTYRIEVNKLILSLPDGELIFHSTSH